jgi:hypothetical protein
MLNLVAVATLIVGVPVGYVGFNSETPKIVKVMAGGGLISIASVLGGLAAAIGF